MEPVEQATTKTLTVIVNQGKKSKYVYKRAPRTPRTEAKLIQLLAELEVAPLRKCSEEKLQQNHAQASEAKVEQIYNR